MLGPVMLLVLLSSVHSLWLNAHHSKRHRTRRLKLQVADANEAARSVDEAKAEVYRVALFGGRGVWARPAERERAAKLVRELESKTLITPALRDGTWELILSDVEPFRASAFFLALGEAVEANIKDGASDGALTVHSLATGGGEVGRVAHVIEEGGSRLLSLVELKSGSLPSLPLALTGTVISTGALSPAAAQSESTRQGESASFTLSLKNTSVQGSKVVYGLPSEGGLKPGVAPDLLSWVGNQLVPSGEIFSRVLDPLGGGQTALLQLSYADQDLMIWRTPRLGDHFFVLARGDAAAWPELEELRQRETSASTSALGSAFALGMLNPFFSRAAGLRK